MINLILIVHLLSDNGSIKELEPSSKRPKTDDVAEVIASKQINKQYDR